MNQLLSNGNLIGQNQSYMYQQGCGQIISGRTLPSLAQLGHEQPHPAQQRAESTDFSKLTAPWKQRLNEKDEAIRTLNKILTEEVNKNETLAKELYEKTVKIEMFIER